MTAGTEYVASYFSPDGFYAFDRGLLRDLGVPTRHCRRPSDRRGDPNGVYRYDTTGFPTGALRNDWVDVVLDTEPDVVAPVVSGVAVERVMVRRRWCGRRMRCGFVGVVRDFAGGVGFDGWRWGVGDVASGDVVGFVGGGDVLVPGVVG